MIGTGPERVKLRWFPPASNREAVEEYVVHNRAKEGGSWEEVARTAPNLKPRPMADVIIGEKEVS